MIETDSFKRQILCDVLRPGLSVEHFNGDHATEVVAAEAVEIINPLILGNGFGFHESSPCKQQVSGRLGRSRVCAAAHVPDQLYFAVKNSGADVLYRYLATYGAVNVIVLVLLAVAVPVGTPLY